MDKATVFIKSAKGRDAVSATSRDISLNQRRILIMIDGKTSVDELVRKAAFISDVEAGIEQLFQGGYILPAGSAEPAATAAATAPQKRYGGGALTADTMALIEHELVDVLGPIAALLCEEALANCRTVDDALSMLSAQLDPQQAKQFGEKVSARLARG